MFQTLSPLLAFVHVGGSDPPGVYDVCDFQPGSRDCKRHELAVVTAWRERKREREEGGRPGYLHSYLLVTFLVCH